LQRRGWTATDGTGDKRGRSGYREMLLHTPDLPVIRHPGIVTDRCREAECETMAAGSVPAACAGSIDPGPDAAGSPGRCAPAGSVSGRIEKKFRERAGNPIPCHAHLPEYRVPGGRTLQCVYGRPHRFPPETFGLFRPRSPFFAFCSGPIREQGRKVV
jgi:hypothetical protein